MVHNSRALQHQRLALWVSLSCLGLLGLALPAVAQNDPKQASSDPPACSPQELVDLLAGIFPPAPPAARIAAIERLAVCGDRTAVGPVSAVMRAERDVAVRGASVRALGRLGGDYAIANLRLVVVNGFENIPVRFDALRALAALGDHGALRPLLSDARVPLGLRVEIAKLIAPSAPLAVQAPSAPDPSVPKEIVRTTPAAAEAASVTPVTPIPSVVPPVAAPHATNPVVVAPVEVTPTPATPPAPPPLPLGDRDGTALALTTSIAAGGLWGTGLSLLGDQNSVGVVTMVGSAGAVIGGGTAFALTRFGLRPTVAQAAFYANATGLGTLAGIAIFAGSGSDNPKLRYSLLVGGETAGIAVGLWGAAKTRFTLSQILLSDTLILGAGLAAVGVEQLRDPSHEASITPAIAALALPVMVGAHVAGRYLRLSDRDLLTLPAITAASGWTSFLLGSGFSRTPVASERERTVRGATLFGLGAGYLGAAALVAFTDAPEGTLLGGSAALAAGNLFGLGVHMLVNPHQSQRWGAGTALGGLGFLAAGAALAPRLHLRLDGNAAAMTGAGAAYGSSLWALALAAGSTGQPADARVPGGMLAGGVGAAVAGLLASPHFSPSGADHATVAAGTLLGAGAGVGGARLFFPTRGIADLVGTLSGASLGFAGSALFAHGDRLSSTDLMAGLFGGAYGATIGALAPSLHHESFAPGDAGQRLSSGGLYLGGTVAAAGAIAIAHHVKATRGQVILPATAATFGLVMGAGAGGLFADKSDQPERIGAVVGASLLGGAALALDPWLHLSHGLGPSAPGLALYGAAAGWWNAQLALGLVGFDDRGEHNVGQTQGAAWLGLSAGAATGLVLSRFVEVKPRSYFTLTAMSLYGHSLGLGLARLTLSPPATTTRSGRVLVEPPRGEAAFRLSSSLLGLAAGAVVVKHVTLRPPDVAAAFIGTGYGALLGALVPALGDREFRDARHVGGGIHVGLALGGIGATAVAHATDATAHEVAVATTGSILGLGAGAGFGMLVTDEDDRAPRIGLVAGSMGGIASALVLDRALDAWVVRDAALRGSSRRRSLAFAGGAFGVTEGVLLAGLIAPGGLVDTASSRHLQGGALLGGSLGIGSGLLLSKFFRPSFIDYTASFSGAYLGGLLGAGVAMVSTDSAGAPDTAAVLLGTGAGFAGAALTQRWAPLETRDVFAGSVGLSAGWLVGALAPTLGQSEANFASRSARGGKILGLSSGVFAAVATRKLTDASNLQIGLTGLGAVHGALTGLGAGMLWDQSGQDSAQRIGLTLGTVAGLGVGGVLWTRLTLDPTDGAFIASATTIAAWTGAWLPALGHARADDVADESRVGGALLGAGAGSLLATALVPALTVDPDLLKDALVLHAAATAAGAGAGAALSARADAPAWGLLGGGAFGLAAGAVMHDRIAWDDSTTPLLALSSLEGLWYGAWLPYAVLGRDDINDRNRTGSLAAGALGGFTLAALASATVKPDAGTAGLVGFGSALGASLAGGGALIADDLSSTTQVRLMLGGTTVGLVGASLLAPHVDVDTRAVTYGSLGGALGASEGLLFAWAGRADGDDDYWGAALVGAGLGGTLGMVSAAAPRFTAQRGYAAAGFAAWGGWVGAFSGAYANRDSHEVTLGTMLGTNAGLAAGFGLLQARVIEPRDFGWISLAGAAGTVLAGGVGAALSTRDNPDPALAGLAAGPLVGMLAGALWLPTLRAWSNQRRARARSTFAGRADDGEVASGAARSADGGEAPGSAAAGKRSFSAPFAAAEPTAGARFLRGMGTAFDLSHVMPLVGAMPPTPGDPSPQPLLFGLTGLWN